MTFFDHFQPFSTIVIRFQPFSTVFIRFYQFSTDLKVFNRFESVLLSETAKRVSVSHTQDLLYSAVYVIAKKLSAVNSIILQCSGVYFSSERGSTVQYRTVLGFMFTTPPSTAGRGGGRPNMFLWKFIPVSNWAAFSLVNAATWSVNKIYCCEKQTFQKKGVFLIRDVPLGHTINSAELKKNLISNK